MKRLLVCGGRDFDDWDALNAALTAELPIAVIIEGEARGADTMARNWALDHQIPILPFPADWGRFGNAAGPLRNQQMLTEGHPTHGLAFYDKPRAESKGTADMVRRLKKAGVPVKEIGGE